MTRHRRDVQRPRNAPKGDQPDRTATRQPARRSTSTHVVAGLRAGAAAVRGVGVGPARAVPRDVADCDMSAVFSSHRRHALAARVACSMSAQSVDLVWRTSTGVLADAGLGERVGQTVNAARAVALYRSASSPLIADAPRDGPPGRTSSCRHQLSNRRQSHAPGTAARAALRARAGDGVRRAVACKRSARPDKSCNGRDKWPDWPQL